MATAISRFVQGRKLPLRNLHETREVLEPFVARLAAVRRTEADLQKLKDLHGQLVDAGDNFQEFSAINIKWHNAVAAASGNELLSTLIYSISHGIHVATTVEEYNTPETRKQVIHIHARINDAIEAGNADLAEKRMLEHMTATHARPLALGEGPIALTEEERPAPKSHAPIPLRRSKK